MRQGCGRKMGLEIRRSKDIIALRQEMANSPSILAFNSANLETAIISNEAWHEMENYNFQLSQVPQKDSILLSSWQNEFTESVSTQELKKFKRQFTINVTQICNLHCTYCAAGGDGSFGDPVTQISIEKTLPQLRQFIDLVPPNESIHITFLGGEPLLYPKAVQMISQYVNELCSPQEIEVTYLVVTNGTLITPEIAMMLAEIKSSVTISIDGPQNINDRFRPAKNQKSSTEQTTQGLKNLLLYKNLGLRLIGLSGVFGKNNLNLTTAYEFYRQFPVDWFEFNYDYSEADDKTLAEYLNQYSQVLKLAMGYGGEEELRRIKIIDQYFYQIDEQKRIENHCSSGKSFLMIDAKNQLYHCPWEVGQKSERIEWQNNAQNIPYEEKSLIELNQCHNCWAKYLCGGGCMFINKIKTGDKHKKDLQFCERTRYIISLMLLYYQQCRA